MGGASRSVDLVFWDGAPYRKSPFDGFLCVARSCSGDARRASECIFNTPNTPGHEEASGRRSGWGRSGCRVQSYFTHRRAVQCKGES